MSQLRLQADFVSCEILYPETRPLGVTFPSYLNLPPVSSQEGIEDYFCNGIFNSELSINEHYSYGNRIKKANKIIHEFSTPYGEEANIVETFDQVEWVIEHFKKFKGNNHCCIEIAKADDLFLKSAPCLRLISYKIINNELYTTVFFRSNDFVGGFPTNLGGIQLLSEFIASEIEIKTNKMFYCSDGLHIYSTCWDLAKKRIGQF